MCDAKCVIVCVTLAAQVLAWRSVSARGDGYATATTLSLNTKVLSAHLSASFFNSQGISSALGGFEVSSRVLLAVLHFDQIQTHLQTPCGMWGAAPWPTPPMPMLEHAPTHPQPTSWF